MISTGLEDAKVLPFFTYRKSAPWTSALLKSLDSAVLFVPIAAMTFCTCHSAHYKLREELSEINS